jgi:hypothetical protein
MSSNNSVMPDNTPQLGKAKNSLDQAAIAENKQRKAEEKAAQAEATAKQAVNNLLSALKIKRVLYVDNYFNLPIERLIEAFASSLIIDTHTVEDQFPEFDFSISRTDWIHEVRLHWEGLKENEQAELFERLNRLPAPPEPLDTMAANGLRNLVDIEGIDYKQLQPEEWVRDEVALLSDANDNFRILCLFDQEFSVDVGGIESNGVDLLEKTAIRVGAISPSYSGQILLGVFSHYFKIGGERQRGEEIYREKGLRHDLFLPLAKERAREPLSLAKGLQMLVLNQYAGKLKTQVKLVMQAACKEAGKRLDALDVYEFDDVVLSSSLAEGVWEAETMVRLFSMLQAHHGRVAIGRPEVASIFNSNVQTARSLMPRLEETTSREDLLALRQLELYTQGESLNTFHFTLRSGDIFKASDNKLYLLLAQPCDLMVRSTGYRGNTKDGITGTNLRHVDIFEISEVLEGKSRNEDGIVILKYFSQNNGKILSGSVNFKNRRSVPVDVLDLAVINTDGNCKFDLSNHTLLTCPTQFHPAWVARFAKLIDTFKELITRLETLQSIADKSGMNATEIDAIQLAQKELLNPGSALPITPTLKAGVLDFSLVRQAHYRSPASDHLLASYAHFLSRGAEDHDFAKAPERK